MTPRIPEQDRKPRWTAA